MQTHKLQQGTPEWHAHRANHFNASDAPAMMGCSPYETRTELIKRLATGISKEVTAEMQLIFAEGHRAEALARPLAEEAIGDDLYPVTGTNGKHSASFDGLTMDRSVAFEHKSLNNVLRDAMVTADGAALPLQYRVQMEQQCLVSGCEKVLFMASKWDGDRLEEKREAWYMPDLKLRAQIVAGWAQLEADVAAYVPVDVIAKVVAAPVQTLPAVSLRLNGALTVASNLPEISTALRAFIERMVPKPATDQEFANAEAECKSLKKVEDALESGETAALAELGDVDAMRRMVADLRGLARTTRLAREKLVAAEKENRRLQIVTDAGRLLKAHVEALNVRLGKPYMPPVLADFGAAIKGKKNLDSMQDAVDTMLANAKIAANETADRIQVNLNTLRELGGAHKFLFIDAAQLVLKANDDLTALVRTRIADHQRQEEVKAEQLRATIRREEEQRAQQQERDRQANARQEALDAESTAQAGIAEARATAALPEPLLEALTDTAAHVRAEKVAEIDAGHVIASAQRPAAARAPATDEPGTATLLIGAINAQLEYIVNAAFLSKLGFEPARVEGARRFYLDSDLPRIGRAIAEHSIRVTQLQTA
ncbi:endonuclease [Xylophilus sp. Kf1]|nr:endonuclease [Xylophilus sp. Kf1]